MSNIASADKSDLFIYVLLYLFTFEFFPPEATFLLADVPYLILYEQINASGFKRWYGRSGLPAGGLWKSCTPIRYYLSA